MDLELKTKEISFCETVFETVLEQIADADISLPDYCPDVVRVLSCEAEPSVNGVSVAEGRMTLDAEVRIRAVYSGSGGKLCSFERSVPFRKVAESGEITKGCCGDVVLSGGFVNCRAAGPRRLDVHASVSCRFTVQAKKNEKLLSFAGGGGILCRSKEYETVNVTGRAVRFFPMSETVPAGGGDSSVNGILSCSSSVRTGSIKVINDKMLVKGELSVIVCCIGEDGEAHEIPHTMPLSQIIELEGLSENNICSLRLNVAGLEVMPTIDQDGKNTLLEIGAIIRADLFACLPEKITLIEDAYSTEREPELKMRGMELGAVPEFFCETFEAHCSAVPGAADPDTVIAVHTSEPVFTCTVNGNAFSLSGTFEAGVLFRTSGGEYDHVKKTVSFDYSKKLSRQAEKTAASALVSVLACSCTVSADGKLEIRAELQADCSASPVQKVCFINDIKVSEDNKREGGGAALTVCYCDAGESLWSIAKKYRSTVDAIKEENGIDCDVTEESMMLVIPGA